jgi:elongation factor 2
MNKGDRCILEMQMEPEDMYLRFRKSMEDVNVIISTYNDELLGDIQVAPEKGTVAFGSGLHGWGFNVERFAKIYAAKMGVDKDKMMKRLWGDSFFNAKKKTWTNVMQPEGCDEPLQRAFCQFIMTPIAQLMRAIMNDDKAKYEKMMTSLNIVLKGDDKNLTGKPLMKRTMQIWINAADTLLSMIVSKLPSPVVAQKYRTENLYEGPMDDTAATAMKKCDPKGPLMMYSPRWCQPPTRADSMPSAESSLEPSPLARR